MPRPADSSASDFVKPIMAKNYTPSWVTLGTVSGHLYGMVFKGSNKSTVWYSVAAFKNAGVKPPKAAMTFEGDFVPTAATVKAKAHSTWRSCAISRSSS